MRASFKEILVGSMKKGVLDAQENDEDDVQLLEEDFTVGMEDGFPLVRFLTESINFTKVYLDRLL